MTDKAKVARFIEPKSVSPTNHKFDRFDPSVVETPFQKNLIYSEEARSSF